MVDQSAKLDFTRESSLVLPGNAHNIAEVIASGEAMDWQWLNVGAHKEYPERLLPSEYLKRQVYGMYWFEKKSVRAVIDEPAGNLMFETDFPHATSLSPSPASEPPAPDAPLSGVRVVEVARPQGVRSHHLTLSSSHGEVLRHPSG
jgi:hypothetical protein